MGQVITEVLPLALGAAVSPAVLGALVIVLATGTRNAARGWALVIGAALPLMVLSALVIVVWDGTAASTALGDAVAWIDVCVGVLLLLAGIAAGLRAFLVPAHVRARRVAGVVESAAAQRRPSLLAAGASGVGFMSLNATTLALYIPAMKDVAASELSLGAQFVVAAVVLAITLAPLWGAVVAYVCFGQYSQRVLSAIGRWLTAYGRFVTAGVFLLAGAYLLAKGIIAV